MSDASIKGSLLEDAVELIEKAIFQNNPDIKESNFSIERNKICIVDGVKHEVDIYVTVDVGYGYKSTYIFECKNWKKRVGKNEIVQLSEKIRSIGATFGYFVAKEYSKYAIAQSRLDNRLELVCVTEHEGRTFSVPGEFHYLAVECRSIDVEFVESGGDKLERVGIDLLEVTATLDGEEVDLKLYIDEWVGELTSGYTRKLPTGSMGSLEYEHDLNGERSFDECVFTLDDRVICEARLKSKIAVTVYHPTIVSVFDVCSRGRVIKLEPLSLKTGELAANFVFTH